MTDGRLPATPTIEMARLQARIVELETHIQAVYRMTYQASAVTISSCVNWKPGTHANPVEGS